MIERLLIVGHGSIGKRHLRIAREVLPKADIRVLRHQPCIDVPEFADGSFSCLIDACAYSPQAAIIANPAPFHLDAAFTLMNVGAHLLVEKPLSHDTNKAFSLIQQMNERNLTLHVGYNLRYLSSLKEFKKLIQMGSVGRVLSVRCEVGQYLPSWRAGVNYQQSVSAQRELGGGVLLELSHELDYLRWIFGEVAWVNAWVGQQSALEVDVEDTAHLILGFVPDVFGHTQVATVNLDFIRHDTTRMCTVIGEQGSLRWNGITGMVEAWSVDSLVWETVFHDLHQGDEMYRAEWQDFLTSLRNQQTPQVRGEDGLAVLDIISAAKQSSVQKGVRTKVKNSGMLVEV
ncbi:MAG: Gfo/Idh/MocA family oxidoreductase [Legionellaceae bacterium]|nr:Gfo/Idh/MocA family oxidoreductase [Legionellaceae bacterium]